MPCRMPQPRQTVWSGNNAQAAAWDEGGGEGKMGNRRNAHAPKAVAEAKAEEWNGGKGGDEDDCVRSWCAAHRISLFMVSFQLYYTISLEECLAISVLYLSHLVKTEHFRWAFSLIILAVYLSILCFMFCRFYDIKIVLCYSVTCFELNLSHGKPG